MSHKFLLFLFFITLFGIPRILAQPGVDTTGPTFITFPSDQLEYCESADYEAWLASQRAFVTAEDDGCGLLGITDDAPPSFNKDCGQVFIVFTATDSCGNTTPWSVIYQVRDTAAPIFLPIPDTLVVSCQAVPPPILPKVSDNCDSSLITFFEENLLSNGCGGEEIRRRSWVALDNCGNADTISQILMLIDTIAPVLSGIPDDTVVTCDMIPPPPIIGTQITATDVCEGILTIAYTQVTTQNADPDSCSHYSYSILRRWSAMDDCGNASIDSQLIDVIDTTAPTILTPPDITVDCQYANLLDSTGIPGIEENCDTGYRISYTDVLQVGSCPQQYTIRRTWASADACGNTDSALQLIVVRDTSPPLINQSAQTVSVSCTAPINVDSVFTNWLDSLGFAEVADLCGFVTGFAAVPGSYDQADPTTWPGTYPTPIDTVPCPAVIPGLLYEETVDFVFSDECGNVVITTATFTVVDTVSPVITACAPDTVLTTLPDECEAEFSPQPPNAADQCSETLFYFYKIDQDTLPLNPQSPTSLVLGEGLHELVLFATDCSGNTSTCSQMVQVIDLQPPSIGCPPDLSFSFPDNQPCDQGFNITMEAPTMSDNCQLANGWYFSSGASQVAGPLFPGADSFSLVLNPGVTFLNLTAVDASGLTDTCQVTIDLIDGIPPVAVCQPVEVLVNPSGLDPYILTPDLIDGGSTDNCSIVSYELSDDTLTCNQSPSLISVNLTVSDAQGNSSQCVSLVKISTIRPQPSYLSGLCGGDTLQLFANPPTTSVPSNIAFNYSWSGPQSFSSTQENPIRPSVTQLSGGTYSLTITGTTGCTSSQTTEVVITEQPSPPVLSVSNQSICIGDELVLQTSPYSGSNISYCWYLKTGSQDSLLTITSLPQLTLAGLDIGNYSFSLEVKRNGCASGLSAPVTAAVTAPPTASVNEVVIERCEGESFSLGTPVVGPGYTYQWTGPGFFSNLPVPPEQTNIKLSQAGIYELVIFLNGCASDPVFTQVEITPSPPQPDLASSGPVCQGEELTIFTDLADGELYTWKTPNLGLLTTTEPVLTIPAATLANSGVWEVVVTVDGCVSPSSEGIQVTVDPIPVIEATNNGPGCEGGNIQLSASDFPAAAYLWKGPGGFQSSQKDPVSNAVAGWYVVEATTPPGCADIDSTLVTVIQPPTVTAGSASPSGCVMGEEDVVLTVTVFPPDNGFYQYAWSGPTPPNAAGPVATLPNATSDDNGSYTLVVTDSFGCQSQPFAIPVELTDAPVTPSLMPAGPLSRCEGESVTLSTGTSYDGSVSYIWTTPAGTVNTTVPSLTIPNLQPAIHTGLYALMVIRDGCSSNSSGEVMLTVKPLPNAPLAEAADDKVCIGDTIALMTPFQPGLIYEWTGPAGFSSNTFNPVRYPAQPIHEGAYAVRVISDGCASPYSALVNINILDLPPVPVLQHNGPVCIDDPDAQLSLTITNSSSSPGGIFRWFNAITDTLLGGPTPASTLTIEGNQLPGAGQFLVYAITTSAEGCVSGPSSPVTVQLDEIPPISAFAGDDQALCQVMTTTLQAQPAAVGTGMWTQSGGPPITINNPMLPNTVVSALETGEQYSLNWQLSNGACINYSADTMTIRIDANNEQAEAGSLIKICDSSSVMLQATPSAFGNTGAWSQSQGQTAQGIAINNPFLANSMVSGLLPGNVYVFTWTLSNPGCGDISTDAVQVRVGDASENAFAGPDTDVCEENDATLNALPPQRSIGQWLPIDPDVVVNSPNSPSSSVSGLKEGENRFVWFLTNEGCPIFARDTASIFFFPIPQAEDDLIMTSFSTTVEIDVLTNDLLPDAGFEAELLSGVAYGELNRVGIAQWEYRPAGNFFGEDRFVYQLCSPICQGACTQAEVRIVVEEGSDCTPPSIITPNNDGINDAFIVPCLSSGTYPENTVIIFNQWGDELYRASPYLNNWEGTYNGQVLPASTYFYHVEFGDGSPPTSGFLMIER